MYKLKIYFLYTHNIFTDQLSRGFYIHNKPTKENRKVPFSFFILICIENVALFYLLFTESNYTEIYENWFYPHYQKVKYILTKELTGINDFFSSNK